MNKSLITRPGALQAPQLDYFLLDGSGSMAPQWIEMQAAMDGFCDVLKSQNAHSHGVVQVFDSSCLSNIVRDSTIGAWPTFSSDPIPLPGNMTPLYDAINLMCRSLRDLAPPRASIVICTDGDDSRSIGGSRHTTPEQARALLTWCRDAMGWQVTFLGCDFDNSHQAKLLGANPQNSIGVRRELLRLAGTTLGEKRMNHYRGGDGINFTDDEKTKFGGYLGGPSNG